MELPEGVLPSSTGKGRLRQCPSHDDSHHTLQGRSPIVKFLQPFKVPKVTPGKDDGLARTHGSMGFGMYGLPPDQETAFRRTYAESIARQERVCIDEKLSFPYFNLFMDFDMKFKDLSLFEPHTLDSGGQRMVAFGWVTLVKEYMACVCRMIGTCYPDLAVQLRPPPDRRFEHTPGRDYVDPNTGTWDGAILAGRPHSYLITAGPWRVDPVTATAEVGLHLHSLAPIRLGREKALIIQKACVASLLENFGHRGAQENDWSSVIDVKVYGGPNTSRAGGTRAKAKPSGPVGGIRMIGSHKSVKCSVCKDDEALTKECENCDRRGRLLVAKVHRPEWVLDHNGEDVADLAFLLDPLEFEQAVAASGIRTRRRDETPGFTPPEGFVLAQEEPVTAHSNKKKEPVPTCIITGGVKCDVGQTYAPDSDEAQLVLECIRGMHARYSRVQVDGSGCFRTNKTKYRVRIQGPYSNFCMKVDRMHSSDNIYFEVHAKGIIQKCFSCTDYSSEPSPIPEGLARLLFPDVGRLNKVKYAQLPTPPQPAHDLRATITTMEPEEPYSEESYTVQEELHRILTIRNAEFFGDGEARRGHVDKLWAAYGRKGGADDQPNGRKRKFGAQQRNDSAAVPDDGISWSRRVQFA